MQAVTITITHITTRQSLGDPFPIFAFWTTFSVMPLICTCFFAPVTLNIPVGYIIKMMQTTKQQTLLHIFDLVFVPLKTWIRLNQFVIKSPPQVKHLKKLVYDLYGSAMHLHFISFFKS